MHFQSGDIVYPSILLRLDDIHLVSYSFPGYLIDPCVKLNAIIGRNNSSADLPTINYYHFAI